MASYRHDSFSVEEGASRKQKQMAMDGVLESFKNSNTSTTTSEIIHIKLPLAEAHQNHNSSLDCGFSNNIHPVVRDKIYEYVSLGMTSVPFLKKALKAFVKKEMCDSGSIQPQPKDQSYFPSSHTIQNHVHLALVAGRYSGLDQLNLEEKIKTWKSADPSGHFFFRKCTEDRNETSNSDTHTMKEDDGSNGEDGVEAGKKSSQSTFLFVHQNAQQQQLLKRYGEMVLVDATYRTSKYALPLFLVVVRTNVGYKPIAEFICENETTSAISEALYILKQWNVEWEPKYFMTDYSEQEFQALQLVFPDAHKYLCSFHREQAWIRWTKEGNNLCLYYFV